MVSGTRVYLVYGVDLPHDYILLPGFRVREVVE
jgi:hypothetical protein